MRTIGRFGVSTLAFVLAIAGVPSSASAQTSNAETWPQRTVRLIVPLPPGSGTDIAARMLAERLKERWGQPVIVENRQGADGIPAVTTFVAARDDHQLLFSFAGIITINPLIYERLPYDPAKDLVPIAPVVDNYFGVSASAALKAESLAAFVKIAKAQPGKLNWAASPGIPYYVLVALQKSAGVDMTQVPYREFGPAIQDLTQGRLQLAATAIQLLAPHHLAGTAKLMFVTNGQRSPLTPEVPTATEAGYSDLTFEGTVGIYGWRGMPAKIQERVSKDVQAVAGEPAFRSRLAASGSSARTGSPADFAAAIEAQRAKIAALHRSTSKSAQ